MFQAWKSLSHRKPMCSQDVHVPWGLQNGGLEGHGAYEEKDFMSLFLYMLPIDPIIP